MDLSKLKSLSDEDKLTLTGMIAENSSQIDARWKLKLDESASKLEKVTSKKESLLEDLNAAKEDLNNSDADEGLKRQLADISAKYEELSSTYSDLSASHEDIKGKFMDQKFNIAFNAEAESFNAQNQATGIRAGANQYLLPEARNNFKLSEDGKLEAVNANGEPIGGVTVASWLEEKRKEQSFFFKKPADTGAKNGSGAGKETITQEELNALPLSERYEAVTTKQLI